MMVGSYETDEDTAKLCVDALCLVCFDSFTGLTSLLDLDLLLFKLSNSLLYIDLRILLDGGACAIS